MAILLGNQPFTTPGNLASNNDATAAFIPGTAIVDAIGNKYVYVLAGYTTAAGDAVCINWTDADNNGTNVPSTGNQFEVEQPATATLDSFFGIMLGIVTSGNFGWCQVSGYNQVAMASTSVTAGKSWKCANSSSAVVDDTAQGTVPSFFYGGNTTVTRAGAVPAIGTMFIRGMGAYLGI